MIGCHVWRKISTRTISGTVWEVPQGQFRCWVRNSQHTRTCFALPWIQLGCQSATGDLQAERRAQLVSSKVVHHCGDAGSGLQDSCTVKHNMLNLLMCASITHGLSVRMFSTLAVFQKSAHSSGGTYIQRNWI